VTLAEAEEAVEVVTGQIGHRFEFDIVEFAKTTGHLYDVSRFVALAAVRYRTEIWTVSLNQHARERDVHRNFAQSLGFSPFDMYRDIILPQAIPLMLPPLGGVLVNLVKHSAIVSVIAVFDLTTQARTVVSDTFLAFEIWLTCAAMYLVITIALSMVVAWLERRYQVGREA